MKKNRIQALSMVAVTVVGALVLAGCDKKSESLPGKTPGVAERTGAALDRAAEKTVTATKDVAEKVVEKSGELLEKAGAATEKAGADLQK